MLETSRLFWKVQLTTDEVVSVHKVQYDNELNANNYLVNSKASNQMTVEDFDPVRIKLYKLEKTAFILNRVFVDNKNKLIIH